MNNAYCVKTLVLGDDTCVILSQQGCQNEVRESEAITTLEILA